MHLFCVFCKAFSFSICGANRVNQCRYSNKPRSAALAVEIGRVADCTYSIECSLQNYSQKDTSLFPKDDLIIMQSKKSVKLYIQSYGLSNRLTYFINYFMICNIFMKNLVQYMVICF